MVTLYSYIIHVRTLLQARLPECRPHVGPGAMPERCESWEDVIWRPTAVLDGDLVMYLRAARYAALKDV